MSDQYQRSVTVSWDDVSVRADAALSFLSRLTGLITGEPRAVYFPGTRSIHTCLMNYTIDVLFLDNSGIATRVVPALPPWRVAACRRANAVLEMPAGFCRLPSAGQRLSVTQEPQHA